MKNPFQTQEQADNFMQKWGKTRSNKLQFLFINPIAISFICMTLGRLIRSGFNFNEYLTNFFPGFFVKFLIFSALMCGIVYWFWLRSEKLYQSLESEKFDSVQDN
jgi:hypothetical protein